MSNIVEQMENEELVAYLRRVADDQEECGREATAEDYRAAADRIEEMDAALIALYAKQSGGRA